MGPSRQRVSSSPLASQVQSPGGLTGSQPSTGQCWGLQGRADLEVCPDRAAARSEGRPWTSLGCWVRSPSWGPLVSDKSCRWKLSELESAHLITEKFGRSLPDSVPQFPSQEGVHGICY